VITNEPQYRSARTQVERLERLIDELRHRPLDPDQGEDRRRLEFAAVQSQITELRADLDEYDGLRSGAVAVGPLTSLEDLPRQLIRARIASGMSQRALAEHMGIKEQQIQRYEAGGYSTASLARLRDVAGALQLDIDLPERSVVTKTGERPLVAFISSVMSTDLQWARDATVQALSSNPALVPWAFEYTPPSSTSAVTTYLSKIREVDFLIWLVGDTTTKPVIDEVSEAIAAGTRIWAIELGAADRDAATNTLFESVQSIAKTGKASSSGELRELLAMTFSDEVVRALRDTPGLTRLASLEQLGRRSRERMVSRWTATGLTREESITFADNTDIGRPSPSVLPNETRPLSVLVGDVGSGKSVCGERHFQLSLSAAQRNPKAPIPIFIHARDAHNGLEIALAAETANLGRITQLGVAAVVDGLDEIDSAAALQLLAESRELVHALPSSTILLTSRPVALVRERVPEKVELPLLTEEEARVLVGLVVGESISFGEEGGWPASVRDAIQRPLFAVLLGILRRGGRTPRTSGELLAALVEDVVEPGLRAGALPVLRQLAVKCTDAQGPVLRREIGSLDERLVLAAERTIRVDEGTVDFALPLVTQWFASDALIAGEVSPEALVRDPRRLSRWRYALAIALTMGPSAFVDETMAVLVRSDPGFSSALIEDSFETWPSGQTSDAAMPTQVDPIVVGSALRRSLETWTDSMGRFGRESLVRTHTGDLAPIGVGASDSWLTFGWYRGSSTVPSVSELPRDLNPFETTQDWIVQRGGVWRDERGWAWRWGLELLRDNLKSMIETRTLWTDDDSLLDEALWLVGLESLGKPGSLDPSPLPLDPLRSLLGQFNAERPLRLKDRIVSTQSLIDRVERLTNEGVTSVSAHIPAADQLGMAGTHFVWDLYSADRQRDRTKAVYGAALTAYIKMVNEWLEPLKPRLTTFATLPAVLRAKLHTSPPLTSTEPRSFANSPILEWHLDPLPEGSESSVEVDVVDSRAADWNDRYEQVQERNARLTWLRPEASEWISSVSHHQVLDIFNPGPICALAYKWLQDDLKKLNWN
jgi:transcriptional regulator with XRE-family HTH domain